MKIHLMVNWREEKIMAHKEYEEKEIPFAVAGWLNNSDIFDNWLQLNYDPYDIWIMNDEDRSVTLTAFTHYCREEALNELINDGWEEAWVEI